MPGPSPQAAEASRNGMPKGRQSHQLSISAWWWSQRYGQKLSVFPESCATDKVKVSAQA